MRGARRSNQRQYRWLRQRCVRHLPLCARGRGRFRSVGSSGRGSATLLTSPFYSLKGTFDRSVSFFATYIVDFQDHSFVEMRPRREKRAIFSETATPPPVAKTRFRIPPVPCLLGLHDPKFGIIVKVCGDISADFLGKNVKALKLKRNFPSFCPVFVVPSNFS